MRPERSVIDSPSETKMKGVDTRMAPPRIASGTPHKPMSVAAMIYRSARSSPSPVPRERGGVREGWEGEGRTKVRITRSAASDRG